MQYLHLLCYQRQPAKQLCLVFHEMQQPPPSSHPLQQQRSGAGESAIHHLPGGDGGGGGGGGGDALRELLVECAAAVSSRDWQRAIRCLVHLSRAATPHGDAIERLAFYFSAALARCLCSPAAAAPPEIRALLRLNNLHFLLDDPREEEPDELDEERDSAFLALNQVTPLIRFSHLSANQAILEAVDNERAVHIVDLGIMQGLQWPPLMQALVERRRLKQLQLEEEQSGIAHHQHQRRQSSSSSSASPPREDLDPSEHRAPSPPPLLPPVTLRITGTGPSIALLEQTGARLRDFAETLELGFEFDAICCHGARAIEALERELRLRRGEALVVNCMTQLHRLLPAPPRAAAALRFMRSLSPKILTLAEKESDHDPGQSFFDRFLATLDHFAAVFDSLEATLPPRSPQRLMIERLVLAKEIAGIVLDENGGSDPGDGSSSSCSVIRHQSFASWRQEMEGAGFQLVPPSAFAIAQARLLLRLHYPADGYQLLVNEEHASLFLTWHSKPLVALSTWSC